MSQENRGNASGTNNALSLPDLVTKFVSICSTCRLWILAAVLLIILFSPAATALRILAFSGLITLAMYMREREKKQKENERINRAKEREQKENERISRATEIIDLHMIELTMKRRQLLLKGDYGIVDNKKWFEEITRFYKLIIAPNVGEFSDVHMSTLFTYINKETLEKEYVKYGDSNISELTPLEYEQFIAKIMISLGWDARTTKGSGDQGIDVIAYKGGKVLVIQCKLYSSPVGNAAVQEAISGKSFAGANYAAVVTNNSYTSAAKQLAAVTGVLLLHHDDLSSLNTLII